MPQSSFIFQSWILSATTVSLNRRKAPTAPEKVVRYEENRDGRKTQLPLKPPPSVKDEKYSIGNIANNILYFVRWQTYHHERPVMHRIVRSLRWIPGTNVTLYVNYASIKKKPNPQTNISHKSCTSISLWSTEGAPKWSLSSPAYCLEQPGSTQAPCLTSRGVLFPPEYFLNGNILKEIKKKKVYKNTNSSSNFICIQKYIILGKAYDCFQLYIINYKYVHKSTLNYGKAKFQEKTEY